jgi:hypothetical protein
MTHYISIMLLHTGCSKLTSFFIWIYSYKKGYTKRIPYTVNVLTMDNFILLILTVLCSWNHTQLLNVPCVLFQILHFIATDSSMHSSIFQVFLMDYLKEKNVRQKRNSNRQNYNEYHYPQGHKVTFKPLWLKWNVESEGSFSAQNLTMKV